VASQVARINICYVFTLKSLRDLFDSNGTTWQDSSSGAREHKMLTANLQEENMAKQPGRKDDEKEAGRKGSQSSQGGQQSGSGSDRKQQDSDRGGGGRGGSGGSSGGSEAGRKGGQR
jgi:hypothetical protein